MSTYKSTATVFHSVSFTFVGVLLVYCSSPTVSLALQGQYHHMLLPYSAAAVDIALALLIAFLLLCRFEHEWVARNQSFPYAYHPSWNLGPKAFNFQLLTFEIFHTHPFSRFVHAVNLFLEELLWLVIVKGTFGLYGLATINCLAGLQLASYGDITVAICVSTINLLFSAMCVILFDLFSHSADMLLAASKVALVALVLIRTVSHALEPLPPVYDERAKAFDSNFGELGWKLIKTRPSHASWLFILGAVSELAAGIPGRLFNVIVVNLICQAGYRSSSLLGIQEAKEQAQLVTEQGWTAHSVTRDMYGWTTQSVGGCEKHQTV